MDTETKLQDGEVQERDRIRRKRSPVKSWTAVLIAMGVICGGWWLYAHHGGQAPAANAKPAAAPEVTVSKPLVENLDTRLGFLGQFSAVDQVELRAQVGGTLTGIYFKDGAIVHKGDLLFTIDPVPYEIKLAQGQAQLETATTKRVLADQELRRAQELERNDAGTVENVQQRTSDLNTAQAAIDDAQAQIRDARFDLDHCRISAPFTGRIGRHLVSIGNLIAGSRAAASPTTLLATIVSLDPIYLDFDMSEADYQTFSRYRANAKAPLANKVELTSGNGGDTVATRQGTLDFVDNVLDRSSGTIHARATVANPDLLLTPGEFARVRVAVAQPVPTLLIPDASVLPDQSEHIVLTVAADGTVVPKPVEVGELRGGLRVIRSGLTRDDRVIVDGLPYAAPGSKVKTRDGALHYAAKQD
ncbi:efflux RND transporter periplasmic adaptor subunit [Paraburkholderia solisilvae]|uniref:Multidrug resistance protein MdtA n=1 Tax=Paraburkholderia solisilvae TaxID=624376 RepID=A0A6J5CUJ4_9BURK|nr:efflux RND transporter periplasmic adaptor subunit [Paraburkholderia solisilvae]CAB3745810.1 Multidrug resistance protein MdtA [Paraburkholderia solisilvae]